MQCQTRHRVAIVDLVQKWRHEMALRFAEIGTLDRGGINFQVVPKRSERLNHTKSLIGPECRDGKTGKEQLRSLSLRLYDIHFLPPLFAENHVEQIGSVYLATPNHTGIERTLSPFRQERGPESQAALLRFDERLKRFRSVGSVGGGEKAEEILLFIGSFKMPDPADEPAIVIHDVHLHRRSRPCHW